MLTDQMKLNIDDIIDSLQSLDNSDRAKLQSALFELQNDLDLKAAIQEGLEDIKAGRVSAHEAVMKEINESSIPKP
jgi:predicted transcriptional regulator